jgi:hypothetical protein
MCSQEYMVSMAISVQIAALGLRGLSSRMGFSCMINLDFLDGNKVAWFNSFFCRKMVGEGRLLRMGRFVGPGCK